MTQRVQSVVRVLGLVAGYAVIGIFGFWLAPAKAQQAEPSAEAAAEPADPTPALRPVEPLRPFERHPAGPGAIPYAELRDTPGRKLSASELESGGVPAARYREATTDTKESVEKVGTWANESHGAATAAGWSKVTAAGVARAEEQSALNASGLSDTSDLGVR